VGIVGNEPEFGNFSNLEGNIIDLAEILTVSTSPEFNVMISQPLADRMNVQNNDVLQTSFPLGDGTFYFD